MLGFVLSVMLFIYSYSGGNAALNRFCTLSSSTSCATVLQSHAAKVFGKLTYTDIGLIYFGYQLLYIWTASPSMYYVLFAISLPAAVFPAYSLYLQAFVVKKWCPLCLGVIGVLLFQGALAFNEAWYITEYLTDTSIVYAIAILALLTWLWPLINKLLTQNRDAHAAAIELLSFKRNYQLFLPYYQSAPVIDLPYNGVVSSIKAGSPKAPLQLTLITNPLCKACQRAHKALKEMIDAYKEQIAINYVFYLPYEQLHDPRTMIAGWLANTYFTHPEQGIAAIDNWYANPDPKTFDALHVPRQVVENQADFLKEQALWCEKNQLRLTPFLLINQKIFPMLYQIEDLRHHIEALAAYEQERHSYADYSTTVLASNT